jgi:hypothetical protein
MIIRPNHYRTDSEKVPLRSSMMSLKVKEETPIGTPYQTPKKNSGNKGDNSADFSDFQQTFVKRKSSRHFSNISETNIEENTPL